MAIERERPGHVRDDDADHIHANAHTARYDATTPGVLNETDVSSQTFSPASRRPIGPPRRRWTSGCSAPPTDTLDALTGSDAVADAFAFTFDGSNGPLLQLNRIDDAGLVTE